jgi:hypothetical protein
MQRTILSVAIGSAFAAAAGSALALAPGAFDPATIAQVYISGATAQNAGIEAVVRRECQAGTLDTYAAGTTQRVYICNSNGNFGTAGTPIAIHKESSGGSSNGINPVKNSTTMAFLNLSLLTAANCPANVAVAAVAGIAPDTLGLPAYNAYSCATSGLTTGAVPQVGFSDVDPALFAMDGSGLNLYSPNQLTFGIAVTKSLRNALQTKQGLVSGSDDADQTPTLSSGQIAAIFNGYITTPAKLGVANAAAVGTNTADQTTIFVGRRGTGSGTQATTEAYFLQNRITNAANGTPNMLAAQATVGTVNYGGTGGTTASDGACGTGAVGPTYPVVLGSTKIPVFAGSSNDQVVNCLDRHNAGNRYGVALLTMEYNQFATPVNTTVDTTYATGFRYVKVDGYLPTLANVIKQNYTYFSEQVVTSLSTLTTGIAATVRDTLVTDLGNADVVSSIDANFTKWNGFGEGNAPIGAAPAGEQMSGLLGPGRSASCKATFASLGLTPDTDPVNYTTKNPSGAKTINAIHAPVAVCPPRY